MTSALKSKWKFISPDLSGIMEREEVEIGKNIPEWAKKKMLSPIKGNWEKLFFLLRLACMFMRSKHFRQFFSNPGDAIYISSSFRWESSTGKLTQTRFSSDSSQSFPFIPLKALSLVMADAFDIADDSLTIGNSIQQEICIQTKLRFKRSKFH